MIVRPKTGAVLMFMCPGDVVCSICVYHQQRWDAEPDGNMVLLKRKNIIVKISNDEFNETFKVVEE